MDEAMDEAWESIHGPVRPFTLVGTGLVRHDVRVETVLVAGAEEPSSIPGMPEVAKDIVALLEGPLTVADVAAAVHLPIVVAQGLVSRLVDAGHLHIRSHSATQHTEDRPSVDLMKKVLLGLRQL